MSKREAAVLLDDIRTAITKIQKYTVALNHDAFLADEKTVDAVVRNLEIIGEAVRQLAPEIKATHPEIAWVQIAGLRKRIVHDYAGVDLEVVWEILRKRESKCRGRGSNPYGITPTGF